MTKSVWDVIIIYSVHSRPRIGRPREVWGKSHMEFFDIHSHILCGVDDGARTEEDMHRMLRAAYEDGIRAICLTPHYSPYLFGDTSASSERAFERLKVYAEEVFPDMQLYLGHELGYHDSCIQPLNDGRCRTMGGSRYLLVDFPAGVGFFELRNAMERLLRMGYRPILAHAERYRTLAHRFGWVEDFIDAGGLIQLNATSAVGAFGNFSKKQWVKFVKRGLVHTIGSDAHNLTDRPPKMSVCIPILEKYCTPEQIYALTWKNAERILQNDRL